MIEKLYGNRRISGDYLLEEAPTPTQIKDKINEIIDVLNDLVGGKEE